ncbi:MAG: CRISPR-associated endoribonuclease Cas6, partial [Candidatus Micrarchaeota archaeon]|nr:CRISPR-associated endoribonuclease Cas6 [Candidatus Micrarchaeota archaeon]
MILQKINLIDPNYATELHDSKLFKFFTFSEFFIKKAKANKQGFNVFSETVSLFVASPNLKFMETFMSGIIYDPVVMIKSTKLELSDIKIIKDPEFTHFLQIKTISPVLITTIKEKENKKVVWDLLPQEDKFYENICKNIYKKWTTFY